MLSGSSESTTGTACERLDTTACLLDDDLLLRYFLDEASVRAEPIVEILDAAPNPLNLTLVTGAAGPTYSAAEGNWGLRWSAAEEDGGAATPVAGTKLELLEGENGAHSEQWSFMRRTTRHGAAMSTSTSYRRQATPCTSSSC
jgi:hypothetical protein